LTRQEFDDVLFFKKKENPNDNENLTTFFLFFFCLFPANKLLVTLLRRQYVRCVPPVVMATASDFT
jgi:hypothetical protein